MELKRIEKLACLLTNPVSPHRVIQNGGEFMFCGSTANMGSFSITIHYEGDDITASGYAFDQYLTVSITEDHKLRFKMARRNGAFIKDDVLCDKKDKSAVVGIFESWFKDIREAYSK